MIVLDMKVTDMSAGALVATMRQWSRRGDPGPDPVPKASDVDRRNYRSAGAQGVIAKPFDPVALPDRVIELLEPAGRRRGADKGESSEAIASPSHSDGVT